MSLLDDLHWRYAAKHLNGTPVPQADVDYIVEAARMAPSSSGLQPFQVLVIRNADLIAQLSHCVYGNQQLQHCSPLLVFAAWDDYTEERVNEYFSRQNAERNLPDSVTDAYRTRLLAHVQSVGATENHHHAAKQAFLSAMCAMMAAAERRIDCTPLEGFEADKVDAILNLRAQGLRSSLLLPLGYRDENNDWLLRMKKVRRSDDTFAIRLD